MRGDYVYYAQLKTKRDDPAFAAAFTDIEDAIKWLSTRERYGKYFVWSMVPGAKTSPIHIVNL
jgi:hypothetical protein